MEPSTETLHELTPSDYERLWQEEKAENERLKTVITAGRLAPVAEHPNKNAKPALTHDRLVAMVGQHRVNNMTRSEIITSFNVDPAGVDDSFLRKCWGRSNDGNDGKVAKELMLTDPLRYRTLREIALALRIFGT